MYDSLDAIDCEKVVQFITKLQNDDGSFSGDQWGEIDTRFSMCAVACLALLVSLFFKNVLSMQNSAICFSYRDDWMQLILIVR